MSVVEVRVDLTRVLRDVVVEWEALPALLLFQMRLCNQHRGTRRIRHEPELTAGHGVRSSGRPEMSQEQSDANDPA
jgi:hypothetical protein